MLSVCCVDLLVTDGLSGRVLVVAADTTLSQIVAGTVGELGNRIFTIEQSGGLLKRASLGLGSPEPDVDELEDEPDGVDEVVLPLEGIEGDGVGVLVEDDSTHDGEVHDSETLGTDEEGQDLDGVGDEEWSVGDSVETVEDEDEREEGTTSSSVGSLLVSSGHSSNNSVGDKHTTGGNDEEWATTNPLDGHGSGDGNDEVVDGEDTVDERLVVRGRDTNSVKNLVEVVRDETVSGPLGEYTDTDDDPHAAAVTWGAEQIDPRNAGSLRLESESLLDFVVLESNKWVIKVTTSVVPGDDLLAALILALVDQPTRGLGEEPDEQELDDGREGLEDGGDTPGPVGVDAEGTESRPSSNDRAREPEGIVERGKRGTVGWVGNLSDQERRSHLCEGSAETDQETRADEHAEILSACLEDSSEQHDGGTEDDTRLAAQTVRDVGSKWDGAEGTNGLDGVEETKVLCRGVSEVLLPALDRLETVHHGTVESVSIGSDQGDDQHEVELDNVAMLPPFASMEHAGIGAIARDFCKTSIGRHYSEERYSDRKSVV